MISVDDEIACLKISRFLNDNFPNTNLITKAESLNKSARLKKIGANYVVVKSLETALQMSKLALISAGIGFDESQEEVNFFRDVHNNDLDIK